MNIQKKKPLQISGSVGRFWKPIQRPIEISLVIAGIFNRTHGIPGKVLSGPVIEQKTMETSRSSFRNSKQNPTDLGIGVTSREIQTHPIETSLVIMGIPNRTHHTHFGEGFVLFANANRNQLSVGWKFQHQPNRRTKSVWYYKEITRACQGWSKIPHNCTHLSSVTKKFYKNVKTNCWWHIILCTS